MGCLAYGQPACKARSLRPASGTILRASAESSTRAGAHRVGPPSPVRYRSERSKVAVVLSLLTAFQRKVAATALFREPRLPVKYSSAIANSAEPFVTDDASEVAGGTSRLVAGLG